jgi:tetratricopeptide (TPR) repeat protein
MPLRSNIGLPLLLVATLVVPALAFSAPFPAPLPQDDPDEVCEAAIESQVWEDVIARCEPLLSTHDESHPSWEFYKENVEYAHTTINYQNQQQCVESAQSGAWDTTLTACPAILATTPDFFVAHLFLGFAHQGTGSAEEAIGSFEEFLTAADANPEMAAQLTDQINMARRNVAIAKSEMGDRGAAIPLLRQVAAADPSDAEAHFRLGFALLQEDDTEGAKEAFSAVIDLNPDIPQLPQVLFLTGQLEYNGQDFESAAGRLNAYLEREPEGQYATEVHWMLGFIAGRNDDQRGMMRHYSAALAADPNNPNARDANYSLGVIAFNGGQCNTAERYFRAFLRLAGGDSRAADVEDMILDIEDGVCEGGF